MAKRGFVLGTFLLGASLSVAACGPVSAPPLEDVAPAISTTVVQPTAAAEATLPAEDPPAAPTETRAVVTDQYATDPATVTLGAGKPTLVKFFAFW